MDILNLIFGLVGTASFGYAIWQNRAAVNARKITRRVTQTICRLASEMANASINTPTEGYARSITQVAKSLLDDSEHILSSTLGSIEIEFIAPQFRTRIGKMDAMPDSIYGYVCHGKLQMEAWTEATTSGNTTATLPSDSILIFGPYRTLPAIGVYSVEFRLRRAEMATLSSKPLVRIDVYDHSHRRIYAIDHLSSRQILPAWRTFQIDFEYPTHEISLEYRVIIMQPNVEIFFESVLVNLKKSW